MPGDHLNILIVGGGAREHALAWRLLQSPRCGRLRAAPGNPGIAALPGVLCLPIGVLEIDRLCEVVRREAIDLVVVGPEAPLQAGLADAIVRRTGAAVFGPSARAAEIESSKVFAKAFMARHGIPTAAYTVANSIAEAAAFLDAQAAAGRLAWVVKADGLSAGKGVTVCAEPGEALVAARSLLEAGGRIIIEECLFGREASCMALCDGEKVTLLPPCEDHKAIGEGDVGPMTGGMGAVCPTPVVSDEVLSQVRARVLLPAARGLVAEGRSFRGLLYAGIMVTADGPRVLEFNCRFGDPETQALMMQLDSATDLVSLLDGVARGEAADRPLVPAAAGAAIGVVMAAAGYPGTPRRGDPIRGIAGAEAVAPGDVIVFHAGTAATGTELATAGGRVLTVTARAGTLAAARARAYEAVDHISFAGAQVRRDIGARGQPPNAR